MSDVYIHAGEVGISSQSGTLKTVLGSCVAVALFDRAQKVAGINHYLLPQAVREPREELIYGNVAIPYLIESLQDYGAKCSRLQAKVFGGASMVSNLAQNFDVGRKNVEIAFDILQEYRIPIVAEDTGGLRGRHLAVCGSTFSAEIRYLGERS